MTDTTDRRWCSRVKKNGERCRKAPIAGGTVCMSHGGAAAHVRAAAQRRLAELVDPAIGALERVINDSQVCGACGKPCGHPKEDRTSSVVRASTAVLDRSGHGPSSSVQVTSGDEWLKYLTDDELHQVEQIMERAQGRMDGGDEDEEETLH